MMKMTPAGVAAVQRGMAARPDSVATLATIDVPMLLITGDEDVITGVNEAEPMQRQIRGSTLTVIPHAGPLRRLRATEEAARIIRQFLDAARTHICHRQMWSRDSLHISSPNSAISAFLQC